MPLQVFPLLQDNTRLVRFKDTLYKIKVKYNLSKFADRDVAVSQLEAHGEIEQTFRAVLYLNERNQTLKTIATPNFLIQPYKIPWSFPRKCSDYSFQQNGKSLKVFDHMFEFHIRNREVEKFNSKKAHGENQGLNHSKRSDVATVGDKLKQAVVIVTDINLESTTRFGRTRDGQLYYRVYSHNTAEGQESSSAKDKRPSEDYDQHERENQSPKKDRDMSRQLREVETGIDGIDVEQRDDQNTHESNKGCSLQLPIQGRKGESRKQAFRKEKYETSNFSSREKEEMDKQKLNTSRDKFSLRFSELRELKRENVQAQRLRSRKMNHLDQKVNEKEYKQGVNNRKSIQRDKLTGAELKHEKMKTLRKTGHTSSSTRGFIDTSLSTKNQLTEGAHINRRQLRGNRHQSYITVLDTSSLSELESTDQSVENDEEERHSKNDYYAENSKNDQRNVKKTRKLNRSMNLRQNESRRDLSVLCEKQVETKQKRHSLRLNKLAKQQDSSVTESEMECDADTNISRKLGSQMSDYEIGQRSVTDIDSKTDNIPSRTRVTGKERKSESNKGEKDSKKLCSTTRSESSLSSSDIESGQSPRKSRRLEKKRESELSVTESEEETQTAGGSQGSARSRKVKLYASRHSPQVVGDFGLKPVTEISSPRVSTVLPVKRNHASSGHTSQASVSSPRITRQSLHDEELRRIQGLREERPTQIYRDIMLAQGRDRYMVEQAENAETDKLRQLYGSTVPRRSLRSAGKQGTKRRRSSGIWGKIIDTLVTPTKRYMFGAKK